MKVQLMHVTQPQTHNLLRPTLQRVMEFTRLYESDANLDVLFVELVGAYFNSQPTTRFWVGLDDAGKVVAHLIATIDDYYGGRFVTIHQCWKNVGVDDFTLEEKKQLVEVVKEFGRPYGCTDVRTHAINEQVAQVLETYGFARTGRVTLKVLIEPLGEEKEN